MRNRRGFTLIEFSIVLVVVGFLIGGVLVAREMIQAFQIRKIVSAHEDLAMRYNAFTMKYNCIPGDCPNATNFWGAAGGCPSWTPSATCNGDGNGHVLFSTESGWFWNHLYHAGLGQGYASKVDGVNLNFRYLFPPIRKGINYENEVFWLIGSTSVDYAQMYAATSSGCTWNATDMRGVGVQTVVRNSPSLQPVSPAETVANTFAIDSKVDDGRPCTGKFHASSGHIFGTSTWTSCVSGSGNSAIYNLSQTGDVCRYIFQLDQ
ncbi:MAG: prepilin-type N-terminal cleavage/methylation domain-containing protein [Planctomycetaceae bacterium]|nr:prepilin-type N-terminal cleavage/methylation domain-containing protein [Planctomycetaceae bacterium]